MMGILHNKVNYSSFSMLINNLADFPNCRSKDL